MRSRELQLAPQTLRSVWNITQPHWISDSVHIPPGGSGHVPGATADLTMAPGARFCDLGHTDIPGGAAYTRWLAKMRDEIRTSARS